MLNNSGGRPYEEQVRGLYSKYQNEFEECQERLLEARKLDSEDTDVIHGRYTVLRSLMSDLYRLMKNCGYLDADEIITRKLKTNRVI